MEAQVRRVLVHERSRAESISPEHVTARTFCGGALYGVEFNNTDEPVIFRIPPEGRSERVRFGIPGGRNISIFSVAADGNGTIAAVGMAYSGDGRLGTFLARLSPDRKQQTVTQLTPYWAKVVTLGPDGVAWAAGWLRSEDDKREDYNIVRRFGHDGALISSLELRAYGKGGPDATELSAMKANSKRVVWLTNANEVIEFAADGKPQGRFPGPPLPEAKMTRGIVSLALSETDDLVVGVSGQPGNPGPWIYDRQTRAWQDGQPRLEGNRGPLQVLGFDGGSLVTLGWEYGQAKVHRLGMKVLQ